ncbi:hypothetical protein OIU76_016096 [Salix suchowensis]|nr:hypothetical protein OIU76_016096 [Salix suchowensis]
MGEFLLQTYGSLDCTYSLFKVLAAGVSIWTTDNVVAGTASAAVIDYGERIPAPPQLRNLGVLLLRLMTQETWLLSNGNMSLTWNDGVVYWNQGLSSASELKLTSPNLQLQSN